MKVALASVLPIAAATAGALWATRSKPSQKVRSAVQHLAGGLVFAVVATELVPDLKAEHRAGAVIAGFVLGVAVMLGVDHLSSHLSKGSDSPLVTVVVVGIDLAVDGLLLGIGFAEGGRVGPLLAVALSAELLGLGIAVALALAPRVVGGRAVVAVTGLSLFVLGGGLLGATTLAHLRPTALSLVLAFATVALLYLVTEELLTEAHDTEDTPVLTAMFFAGFLVVTLLSLSG